MDDFFGLITIVVFAMVHIAGVMFGIALTEHDLSKNLIAPCELELPRSQECHLIAVPVEK